MTSERTLARREFIRRTATAAVGMPMVVSSKVFGANDKINMGCIGIGGRGFGDMRSFMGFDELRVVAVCEVAESKRERAKQAVDDRYGNKDCAAYVDFREITSRSDIDTVMIATPDHWHVLISIEAMKNGKDVFCEKPETLTIREGRMLVETEKRYGRVFSGGSQRVWGDYNWYHRMIRGGVIGEVQEVWVNCGGPSSPCYLPEQPVPEGLDWNMWLGPAPWVPFNGGRLNFRPWRDYSGGGMTDWGAHNFGGALFSCNLHRTGPVEVIPPDGKDHKHLTYVFANGLRMYHNGGWDGRISFKGTDGEVPKRDSRKGQRQSPPEIHIPNYKGHGGFFGDFVHCVRTREKPFRDVESAHRTVTVCHLGNLAYWLKRPLKWDPVKEEIVGDSEANRWLDRPKRSPWII